MRYRSRNVLALLIVIYIFVMIFQLFTLTVITGTISQVTGSANAGQVSIVIEQLSVTAPYNLTATLNPDNYSIDLKWECDSVPSYYVVYYSSNLSELYHLDMDNPSAGITVVSGIPDKNWTDPFAGNVQQRFYTVAAVLGLSKNLSKEKVGKFMIEVRHATLNPGELEFNTISFPLNPSDCHLGAVLPTPAGLDVVSWYNPSKSPPSYDSAYYFYGNWYGDFDCFEAGKAYVFGPITEGYNITLTGSVPEGDITMPVSTATLNPGEVEINTIGWNTMDTRCNLASLIPTPSGLDVISYYNRDKSPPSYDSSYYFYGAWYGDFDCLEPGKGYVFGPVTAGYSWTYNRSIT